MRPLLLLSPLLLLLSACASSGKPAAPVAGAPTMPAQPTAGVSAARFQEVLPGLRAGG